MLAGVFPRDCWWLGFGICRRCIEAAALNVWAFVLQQRSFLAVGLGILLLALLARFTRDCGGSDNGFFFLPFAHMTCSAFCCGAGAQA